VKTHVLIAFSADYSPCGITVLVAMSKIDALRAEMIVANVRHQQSAAVGKNEEKP
jgi:hypothetical protein